METTQRRDLKYLPSFNKAVTLSFSKDLLFSTSYMYGPLSNNYVPSEFVLKCNSQRKTSKMKICEQNTYNPLNVS
jgi:hypothetical protein